MNTYRWIFIDPDGIARESVDIALVNDDNDNVFETELGIAELLTLLNGGNMQSFAQVDVYISESIVGYARDLLGDRFDAATFFEREVVVEPA